MSPSPKSNMAHSIHQRLLNVARSTHQPFGDLLQQYVRERFLCRLSVSPHRDALVLKGATMLRALDLPSSRLTMDIDFLARIAPSSDTVERMIRDCMKAVVEDDGLRFDGDSLVLAPIAEDARFSGVRVRFLVFLGRSRITQQIDIGFGDAVALPFARLAYPTLLGTPGPEILAYPVEVTIAEKYQAMVDLGQLNSRMKDFYDIYMLASHRRFDGRRLGQAIGATFAQRSMPLPSELPVALTAGFATDRTKQIQWGAFLRRAVPEARALELHTVVDRLVAFLVPPSHAIAAGRAFDATWPPGGQWRSPEGDRA